MISHFVYLYMTADRLDLKGENDSQMLILFPLFTHSPHPTQRNQLTAVQHS